MLHMDLFGPTFVRSINHKTYCLVVTDDFSRFSWVFFLATKDETSGILKTFITGIENQINHKVKIIICDNGTEFKNNDMNQFCRMKGIKREFSIARTPQQNRVAERKNRTLIEAARTMLADSLLPTTFWAEAVNTACYVQNRVLVTKPHNKTPYELLHGRPPSISFMRPLGCPMTLLNTLNPLGKFDGKADEGFLVGYSINSKAFRVFNTRTRKVEKNLHITILENKPNVAGSGPEWLFDIDLLTNSMNYEPVTVGNQTNRNAVADDAGKKTTEEPANEGERNGQEKEGGASNKEGDQNVRDLRAELDKLLVQQKEGYANSTNRVSTVSPSVSAAGQTFVNVDDLSTDPLMPDLEDTTDLLNTGIFSGAYDDEDVGAEADLNNLETTMNVSPITTTIIHTDHLKDQIIRDINSATQTRRMTKISEEHAMKVIQALADPRWVEAMQEELLQFRLQKVWTLVDLPNGKRAIGTKWVFRNKKDKRGIVVRNKARLVAQDGISNEFGVKTSSCKVNAARHDLVLLGFIDQHNMVSCLERIEGNDDFHQIVDFLNASTISLEGSTYDGCVNEAVYTGEDDRVVRVATTATILEAEQESGNIYKTRSTETFMATIFLRKTSLGCGQGCKIPTWGMQMLRLGGHTPGSDEGRPNINELMAIYTNLSNRVLALETSKTAQDLISTFKRKSLDKENVSKQGRNLKTKPMFEEGDFDFDDIDDMVIEAMENVEGDTVNTATTGVSAASASITTAGVSISTAKRRTPPTTTTTAFEDEDLTIAQTLVKMRSQKDKEKGKGVTFRAAQEESARPTRILPTIDPKDKDKGIMQEPEKPLKNPRKAQIQMDEELALRLLKEEKVALERMQRDRVAQEEASNAALTTEFDDVQARMDAVALLVARLQEEEREKFSIDEQARFLVETIAERKRFFAAQRAEQIRNKPPTKTQLRNKMITFLKNMGRFTYNQLKNKSLEEIQKLYEREQKWINDFVPMDSEMVKDSGKKDDDSQKQAESSKKRPRAEHDEESVKKQKLEDDAEKEELRACLDIVPGDDIAINVESLATKYPIVDWKTHILTENMMYYQIIRADGSSKNYKIFSEMLDDFDRQDVVDLYSLVKERYEIISPEGYDRLLWGDLITLFESSEEDEIWKGQQDYKLISWRLFDSCGVHVLLMNTGVAIHMMVEKKYPLTQEMLSRMLNRRLEVDHESTMAFELIRFIKAQLEE
ncbi:putative ribonuclease H-like domain-containing protein [Tanacetum coccineum]